MRAHERQSGAAAVRDGLQARPWGTGVQGDPVAALRMAAQLRAEARRLDALAAAILDEAHEALGRFAAGVVASAERAPTPAEAAAQVAEAFLALGEPG